MVTHSYLLAVAGKAAVKDISLPPAALSAQLGNKLVI